MQVLGLDLGITSVGWALVDDEKNKIIDAGVRIFSQSTNKDNKSLAAIRREKRSARKLLQRKSTRLKKVKQLLLKNNILNKKELANLFSNKKRVDVWRLRHLGLHRKLTNIELSRVLIHIAKRRGFQSNSKKEDKKNSGVVLDSIQVNQEQINKGNYLTIGNMLYSTTQNNKIRRNKADKNNKSTKMLAKEVLNTLSRDLLKKEIDILFEKQRSFANSCISDELKNTYKQLTFTQKPFASVGDMVGKCTYEKNEKRGAKNAYSMEYSSLLSKTNNTDLINPKTGEITRLIAYKKLADIISIFHKFKSVTYKKLKKELNISNEWFFKQLNYHINFEDIPINSNPEKFFKTEFEFSKEQQTKLLEKLSYKKGDKKLLKRYKYTNIRKLLHLLDSFKFKGVKYNKDIEKTKFFELNGYHSIKNSINDETIFNILFKNHELFNNIATIISVDKDDEKITKRLNDEVFSAILPIDKTLKEQIIDNLLEVDFKGFNELSLKAIYNITPHLEQGLKYHDAAIKVYQKHANFDNSKKTKFLKPLNKTEYKNKITNPTVKRVFAQCRKVINAVVKKHSQFEALHIELARELKNSANKRYIIKKGQDAYKENKENIAHRFEELYNRPPIGNELLKLTLYEQQDGKDLYSGITDNIIDINRIPELGYLHIDHILPWSRTFDNSLNNKILCFSDKNQNKGNKIPFEYLANRDENSQQWSDFKSLVYSMKNIKQAKRNKLLNTTLVNKYGNNLSADDIDNTDNGFIARNLNDTQYATRLIKNFIEQNLAFKENNSIKQKVKARSGAVTDQMRYSWGLGEKDRDTNLHHAQDAIILAFITQREVQRMSSISARRADFKNISAAERKIKFSPPFASFKEDYDQVIEGIFVSFASNRTVSGAAHKETIKKSGVFSFAVNKGSAQNGEVKRVDVFKNDKGRYTFIVLYPHHFYQDDFPDTDLNGNKISDDYRFVFSLFKQDLIEFKSKKDKEPTMAYFNYINPSDGRIAYQKHYQTTINHKLNAKGGRTNILLSTGISLKHLDKYQVDVLGKWHKVKQEKRLPLIKQMRKYKKINLKCRGKQY